MLALQVEWGLTHVCCWRVRHFITESFVDGGLALRILPAVHAEQGKRALSDFHESCLTFISMTLHRVRCITSLHAQADRVCQIMAFDVRTSGLR